MYLLSKNKKIGKIYQILDIGKIPSLNPNLLIILTYCNTEYIKLSYTKIICTNQTDLEKILIDLIYNPTDCLIYSISTIPLSNQIYKSMQVLNSKGSDIFLHTFTSTKLWFTDILIE